MMVDNVPSIEFKQTSSAVIRLSLMFGLFFFVVLLLAVFLSLLMGGAIPTQQLAYKGGDASQAIYLLDVNSHIAVPIYRDTSPFETRLAWSPDGTRLIFISQEDANQEIYMLAVESGIVRNLTNHPANDYSPLWLDNERVLFWSLRDNGFKRAYMMNVETNTLDPVTNAMVNNADSGLTWSPDGTRYALISYRNGKPEIYVRDLEETESRRITDNDSFDYAPTWSPDGTQIAFWSDRDNGQMRIYIMDADGENVRAVTSIINGLSSFSWAVAWSADGEQLAFVADSGDVKTIYAINVDGSNLRQLRTISNSLFPPALAWRP